MSTKREDILKASLKLFNNRGFVHTPTSLIAKEANVATGTLFHHFSNKEELINTLFLSIIEELALTMNNCIDSSRSLKEQFHALWVNDIKWGMQHREKFSFLKQFGLSKHISKESQDTSLSYCDFAKRIEEAVENNELDLPDFEYGKNHYISNIHMNVDYFMANPHMYNEEIVEKTFSIFWRAINHS